MKNIFRYLLFCFTALAVFACAEPVEPEVPASLSVEPNLLQFEGTSSQQSLKVSATREWSVTIPMGADWCSLNESQGNGNADLILSVEENKGNRRSAIFTFQSEGCKNVQLTVIQNAGEPEPETGKTGLYSNPELPDADQSCTIYYAADTDSPFFDYSGSLYAHIGLVADEWSFVQADWNQNIDKCKFTKVKDNLWSLEITPTIREWFGSGKSEVVNIGVVVRSADGKKQTKDLFIKVKDDQYQFIPDEVIEQSLPSGVLPGINYHSDNSVTLVLYDKDKNGKSHDYCYLIGDFSQWKRESRFAMKRDVEAGCWWYTMTGLEKDKEYLFQYHLGYNQGSTVKISDPYSEIIYDGNNDQYISNSTYPGLTAYPKETSGIVSAFQIGERTFDWKVPEYEIKDQDDLIIYELLLRDFNKSKDLTGAMDRLDYLKELGVNAIELMPIQEFDGNLSWGYNPNHYFALDKAYGTREMYKKFIDGCHQRGMAVLVDVVYNHVTMLNPMAKLYADGNEIATNNPWFNVQAPHPYSVFEDWNHENMTVRNYVKRSLQYLLEEYKVDGFRFDLSKGLTQNSSTESTAANYDASRIAILKDYHAAITEKNPAAVTILEHFCEQREEKELAENGMKVWRNMNNAYCQSAMGYKKDSGFDGLYTGKDMPFGSYVGYMESHDEERTCFKSKKYGSASVKNSLSLRMKRAALNAAFFLMVPGPKMIWQFGELGYDISIEEGGRTGEKPVHWDYLEVPERKELHDTYARLLEFRHTHPEFFRKGSSFEWKVGVNSWPIRTIKVSSGEKSFMVIGNFGEESTEVELNFNGSNVWKNFFQQSETYQGSQQRISIPSSEFKLLVNF